MQVLGCGTSELSAWLRRELFDQVVSIDREWAIIETMRDRHPHLGWVWATFEQFDVSGFDAAFDKSTLDATVAEVGDVAELTLCAHRSLEPNGFFVVVSLYPRPLIVNLVAGSGSFSIAQAHEGFDRFVVLVFRRQHASPGFDRTTERDRQRVLLDEWFWRVNPLLTPKRTALLRAEWMTRAPPSGILDVPNARNLLFTEAERAVYDMDDFRQDLRIFRTRSEHRRAAYSDALSLDEALAFLAAFQ